MGISRYIPATVIGICTGSSAANFVLEQNGTTFAFLVVHLVLLALFIAINK